MIQEVPAMEHPPPSDSIMKAVQEVNTALTVIVGNAQLIERKLLRGRALPPDELLAVLALIQRQGYHAAEQINSLLAEYMTGQDEPGDAP
jgi:hypothetical protein